MRKGGALWTPAIRGLASIVARTIPLAPFLRGRGKEKRRGLWRHILHTSCQRAAPSGLSRLQARGDNPWNPCQRAAPSGLPRFGLRLDRGSDHPPGPLPKRKGERKEAWFMEAHPPYLLPEGVHPSGLPRLQALGGQSLEPLPKGGAPLESRDSGLRLDRGSDHPPGPLPSRKGAVKKRGLWRHVLHTSCPRGAPLWTPPLASAGGHPLAPAKGRRHPLDSWLEVLGTALDPCQRAATPPRIASLHSQ